MQGPDYLIDQLGGVTKVADAMKRPVQTVASWKSRGSIPVKEWPSLIELARQREVTNVSYETLTLMHAAKAEAAP